MSLTCQVCGTSHQKEVPFCRECGYPLQGEGLALEGRCIGNYRLVQRIGGGGFGEVYRAEHVELGRSFAIKVLHGRLSNDDQFVERFRREAMVLAGLQHENVVQVVDFGQHPEIGFYLVMEWLEGRSLHRVWRRKRVFPLGQVYALFSQLLDALQLAHSLGVVHRDMKPDNLLLIKGSRGRSILKIVDFGIATIIQQQDGGDPLNQSGVAVGTPHYMSPEQASGKHELVDHRSDIYACGVILVELLTGRRMFKSKDPRVILRHQIETPPPRLKELYPKITYSDALQAVVDRALAKDRNARYHSAGEFFHALSAVMKAENVRIDETGLDSATNSNSAGNLFALVGASADELDGISSTSTPSFQGQKPITGASPVTGGYPPEPPRTQQWALWGGITFGFLLTIALGYMFVWMPAQRTRKPVKRVLGSLPPLDRQSLTRGTPSKQPPQASEPVAAIDAGTTQNIPDEPPTEPTTQAPKPRRRVIRRRPVRRPKRRRRPARRPKRRKTIKRKRPPRRKRIKPPRRRNASGVLLTVITKPPGATVYLSGRAAGRTPFKKRIKRGQTFSIQVKKSGYITPRPSIWRATRNSLKSWNLIEDL